VAVIDPVTFNYSARNATEKRVTSLGGRPPQSRERAVPSRERVAQPGKSAVVSGERRPHLRERLAPLGGREAQLREDEDKRREE